jgi:hypothetical protein
VVKDIDDGKIEFFSLAKAHRKKKCLGVKQKHLWNTKKNTFFYKYEKIKNQKIKISALFPWFPQPQKPNKA